MKSALLKLHNAVFLWGFTGVFGKLISLNEGLLVWYRMLITIVSLFILLIFLKKLTVLPLRTTIKLMCIGTLLAFHWVCFYGSIKYSNVSIALTCLSTSGLFTAFLEPLYNRKKPNLVEIILGLMAIIGIWLIYHFNQVYKTGMIIGLVAALLSVIFSIFNKKTVVHIASGTVMFYELLGGWLALTLVMPIYLLYFPSSHLYPSMAEVGWLLILCWICTIIAFGLSLQSLRHTSVFTQNLVQNLEPVYGILVAFALYHENKNLSSGFYWGFGIIISTVIIQMIRLTKKSRPFFKLRLSCNN